MPLTSRNRALRWGAALGLLGALTSGTSWAAVPKEKDSALDQKEFFRPELYISSANRPLQDMLPQLPNRAAWDAFLMRGANASSVQAFIDPRSGAATNLVLSVPLIPGDGVGNHLTLADLSRRLGKRGLLAIVFARIVPVGPFTIVNLVAGASHIRWRDFLLGTVIGLLPGITAASIFVDRVAAAIREPGMGTFAVLAGVCAVLIATVLVLRGKLAARAEATSEAAPAVHGS